MKIIKKLRLYLDDIRTPLSDDWIVARNYDEFVTQIKFHGLASFEVISLDHDLGKKAENWSLGVYVAIKSQWVTHIKVGEKKTPQNLEARTKLGILVSRKFKEALYLAEKSGEIISPTRNPWREILSV